MDTPLRPAHWKRPRGLLRTFPDKCDWNEINAELGKRFEIAFNTSKPFACGVVIHPSIDGCVQLRRAHGLSAEDIERIALKVHPLVLGLTGKRALKSGLEGKFSVYHGCAAGFIFGAAGESEFSDSIVARGDVMALRDRIEASVDASIGEAAADVTIVCRNGRTLHVLVEHVIGSLERPMTSEDLRRKFHALVDPVLGLGRATSLIERCAEPAAAADVRAPTAMARP